MNDEYAVTTKSEEPVEPEKWLWKFIATLFVVCLIVLIWSNIDMRSSLSKERKAKMKVTKELKATKKELKVAVDELQMYKDGFDNWMKKAKEVDKMQRDNNDKQEELNKKLEKLISQKIEQRRVRVAQARTASTVGVQQGVNVESQDTNGGSVDSKSGQFLGEFEASAYNGAEFGSSGKTASGTQVKYGTVAVDPNIISIGTRLYIENYGEATAEDTGPAIKGKRVDLWMDSVAKCNQFGRKTVKVWLR